MEKKIIHVKCWTKCFVLISSTSKLSRKHSRKYGKCLLFISGFCTSIHSEGEVFFWGSRWDSRDHQGFGYEGEECLCDIWRTLFKDLLIACIYKNQASIIWFYDSVHNGDCSFGGLFMGRALKFAIAHWSVADETFFVTHLGSLSLSSIILNVF